MSREHKQRVQYLLAQYIDGKASIQEENLLFQLLQEEKDENSWEEIVEELISAEPELKNYSREEWQPVIQSILNGKTSIKRKGAVKQFRISRYWIAAASFIAVLIIAGIFYFIPNQDSASVVTIEPQENESTNDIPPGHEGAILTLGNNQQIILDNAQEGLITKEGNSVITKKEGALVYSSSLQEVQEEMVYNTMTTPKGRQYALILSDGSKVWLNAASSITFPIAFSAKERRVIVTGEVYFEVAHNAAKPFVVQKNEMAVEVLGTVFNINAYDDEDDIKVTLLKGSVRVLQSSSGNSILLAPQQQAQVNKNGKITLNNNVDVEAIVAWKNGFFDFKSVDIESLIRQAARWYDIQVEYKGKKPEDRFTGSISRNVNLSEFLKVLEYSEVHAKIEGRKLIIMP